jgi:hypothetical protein
VWYGRATAAGPLTLGLEAGFSYFQHAATPLSPQAFQSRSLEPLIRFGRQTGRSLVVLEARRRFDLYSGQGLDAIYPGTRPTADHALLQLRHSWSPRSVTWADGFYARTHDALGIDQWNVALQSDVAEWGGNVAANLGHIEGDFHTRGWSYEVPGLQDAVGRNWTVRVLPVLQPQSAWFMAWHRREILLGSEALVSSQVAAAGLRRNLSPGLLAEAEAGVSMVTLGGGTRQPGPEAALELRGAMLGPNTLTARLQVERAFPATLTVRASRGMGNGQVWLAVESLVDAQGGLYRYPTFSRRASIGIQDTVARANLVGIDASVGGLRPYYIDQPGTNDFRTSVWLARRMRPWLTGRAGCSYLSQTGEGTSAAPAFHRFRVDAALTAFSR